jgi:transposase
MAQNDLIVVGIDVAKDKVDACIRRFTLRQTFPNTAQGHRKLVAWLRKYQVGKAVMEASGGYEREWRNVLHKAGIEVRIVDPRRVRSFAQSAGRLAKSDPIDAEMIAWFAETFSQAPGQIPDAAREELAALAKARTALVDIKIRLQAQDEHAAPEPARKAYARLLKNLAAEIDKLEAVISAKVKATPEFAERAEIIESVPGLAQATSPILIAGMPELGQVSDEPPPPWSALPLTTMIAASGAASATSRADAAGYETPSTCPVSAQLRSITRCSRPSTIA